MLCKQLGIRDDPFRPAPVEDPQVAATDGPCRRTAPIAVQIAGEPWQLAEAARFNVDHGAQIIDINMGCPAKKVCHVWAGSALMRDEVRVGKILEAVVNAVNVPVTLKTRTGWARAHRNGVAIARIAEASGIAALAMHGRTREDLYLGAAEYDTIAEVRAAISLPLWVNGDIDSPQKAAAVMVHWRERRDDRPRRPADGSSARSRTSFAPTNPACARASRTRLDHAGTPARPLRVLWSRARTTYRANTWLGMPDIRAMPRSSVHGSIQQQTSTHSIELQRITSAQKHTIKPDQRPNRSRRVVVTGYGERNSQKILPNHRFRYRSQRRSVDSPVARKPCARG